MVHNLSQPFADEAPFDACYISFLIIWLEVSIIALTATNVNKQTFLSALGFQTEK